MRHVVVMTLTGALGLMALFLVDLIDLFFLSLLNQTEVTAAIGYAGTIVFANLSITLGVGIAAAALVAQNLGAGKPERASQFATSTLLFALLISGVLTVAIALGSGGLLTLLGAQGEAKHLAQLFIWTMTPGYILISGAITCSFILRGLGDPRRAMYITLSTAVVTALADPLFIFGFGWGIQGAAAATVLGYTVSFIVGLHALTKSQNFLNPLRLDGLRRDLPAIWVIALPAVLTQLATPFANAYVTRAVAPFGDEAVAAAAIVGRLIPVAFGIIFALSGSVGPIIGQNYGAQRFDRVSQTLRDSLKFTLVYVLGAWALLALAHNGIATLFDADETARELIAFFCLFAAGSFLFNGALFVANASFNNLGYATYATMMNWGRSTLGVIPFVWVGSTYYGAKGVLAGWGLGAVAFGIAAMALAFRTTRAIEERGAAADAEPLPAPPAAQSPFTSGKGSTIG